jgi:hypothetical protein
MAILSHTDRFNQRFPKLWEVMPLRVVTGWRSLARMVRLFFLTESMAVG